MPFYLQARLGRWRLLRAALCVLGLALVSLLFLMVAALSSGPSQAGANVFVVDTVSDEGALNGCTDAPGDCSLRGALLKAAAGGGEIRFQIPGPGPHVIQPTSQLPAINAAITINGYTQTGAAENTAGPWEPTNAVLQIVLDGSSAGAAASGLWVAGTGVTIRGLAIVNFHQEGIKVATEASAVITGNFIGIGPTGNAAQGNGAGIMLMSDQTGNAVGGPSPPDRNVISGNHGAGVDVGGSASVAIAGNFIGTNAAGTAALPNEGDGVRLDGGASSFVGSTVPGAGNLISGNSGDGVHLTASAHGVQLLGNRIGTNAAGDAAVANSGAGVRINGASKVAVGATLSGATNLISGNQLDGIAIVGAGSSLVNVRRNLIGTALDGVTPLPNQRHGVFVDQGAHDNTIGGEAADRQNVISYNAGAAVSLSPSAGVNNYIDPNIMRSNGGLGIDLLDDGLVLPNDELDLDSGPNDLQNYPVLTEATSNGNSITVNGNLHSTPNHIFNLFIFSNSECDPSGYGEGETFLGPVIVVTNNEGNAQFQKTFTAAVPGGYYITATGSNPESTSEFSPCLEVEGPVFTPSPTPSPTLSPAASPTPTPTPTPTPSGTPSLTPTSTPTPTPTPPSGLALRHSDNNCDGSIDLVDALGTLRYVAGMPPLPAPSGCPRIGSTLPASTPNGPPGGPLVWGDIDCNGEVDVVDALHILRQVAALPPLAVEPGCPAIGDLLA